MTILKCFTELAESCIFELCNRSKDVEGIVTVDGDVFISELNRALDRFTADSSNQLVIAR